MNNPGYRIRALHSPHTSLTAGLAHASRKKADLLRLRKSAEFA
jgi:hypothetical protein